MTGRKITTFAVVGALVIALAVLAALYFMGPWRDTAQVLLPDTDSQQSVQDTDGVSEGGTNYLPVQVTRENVQDVIATLQRAENHYRSLLIVSSWGDGSAVWQVEAWQLGEKCRITTKSDATQKNVIIDGEEFYLWYTGDEDYYTGSVATLGGMQRLADEFQMISTYEDVLEIDAEDILRAEHAQLDGESCIYVEAAAGELGYTEKYWISLATGLLAAAQTWDGDSMIYSMQTSGYVGSTPPAEVFDLPF